MITYQITNIDKFTDVDVYGLSFYNGSFHGTISIGTNDGWKDITGEHGSSDYDDEYGFVIILE